MNIDTVPIQLNDTLQTEAVFTRVNPHFRKDGRRIEGLNFGLNTSEEQQIVMQNRTMLFKAIGWDEKAVAWANQVHGTAVTEVHSGGLYPHTDALVTNTKGIGLAILVADCAAVLLSDDEHGVIGAAHSGWKGTAGNIVAETIAVMCRLGAKKEFLRAFVSPCISTAAFEVGDEVAAQFPVQFVDRSYTKPHVDLKGMIFQQLIEQGVSHQHIQVSTECTMLTPDLYSYRRDGERSGRMMGLIRLKP